MKNPYEVLGLAPSASRAAIRQAYRDLSKRHHPDNPYTGDRGRFDEIAWAHDLLLHLECRELAPFWVEIYCQWLKFYIALLFGV